MKKRFCFAVLAASLASASAPASAYTDLFAFGDSLSDAGNATIADYLATGKIVPVSPPYSFGHFSNGPTWVEDLYKNYLHFGTLTPSLVGGRDYAVAGAQTGPTAIEPLTNSPADLVGQVAFYGSTHRSLLPRWGTLYTLDIGGNDIMNALSKYGANNTAVLNVVAQAETNTVDAIESLYALGARNLLFYEVPDLGLTPRFRSNTTLRGNAKADAAKFNYDLLHDSRLLPYKQGGLKVIDLDTFDLLDAANYDNWKTLFGLTNVTNPCWTGNFTSSTSGQVCSAPNNYLFWDSVHPTEVAHAETANCAYQTLIGSLTGYCALRVPMTVAFALGASPAAPETSTWAMTLIGFAGVGYVWFRRRKTCTSTA
jgi:phospholipase/lecithinase/hemolysin